MKHTWRARIVTLAIAACLAFSSVPVFADGAKQITVQFEDVTAADATTLSGEAKIKVRVNGADGNVSIAQTAFDFDGDLKYKSVNYLQGTDNPGGGDSQITNINGNKITKEAFISNPDDVMVIHITCEKRQHFNIYQSVDTMHKNVSYKDGSLCVEGKCPVKPPCRQALSRLHRGRAQRLR